ncbi:MAG: DUF4411 family protein [Bacteroidetes bacterium]|nr:DUF4411 family protein [Bacteroidota bacterium]
MLYLIDASSLITIWNTYYSPYMVPEFWSWLEHQIRRGICKMPKSIYDEIKPTDLIFKDWMLNHMKDFVITREVKIELV